MTDIQTDGGVGASPAPEGKPDKASSLPASPSPPTVHRAIAAVMADVQAIGKAGINTTPGQNYRFRGVDHVVNAVGPALRQHGVLIIPEAEDITSEHYTTKKGAQMRSVTLRVRWTIYGPAGDHIPAVTVGEAADAGDKAVSKAHAVAWRTALIEILCIPTDSPDDEPDARSHERATPDDVPAGELRRAKDQVHAAWMVTFGSFDLAEATDHYGRWSRGGVLSDASAPELRRYAAFLASIEKDAGSDPTATDTVAAGNIPRPITALQRKRIFAELNGRGIRDAAEQRTRLGEILGTEIRSRGDLTLDDAKKVIDWFEQNPQTPVGGEGVDPTRGDIRPVPDPPTGNNEQEGQ